MDYFWGDLRARRCDRAHIPEAGGGAKFFHQARIMGGGSSINAQIALGGLPRDFDGWQEAGAKGWNWDTVLPYFRKLERDVDIDNPAHGQDGPVKIRRVPRERWDPFTKAVGNVWESMGHAYVEDLNGEAADGFSAVPFTNDGHHRWSSARSYLTDALGLGGRVHL